MEYKLFDEYITLQALLKELSIIHSGGAIKGFLANNTVLFNGEDEKRRGKKLRYGDVITIPSEELEITDNKKKQKAHPSKEGNKTKRKPVRFPGT